MSIDSVIFSGIAALDVGLIALILWRWRRLRAEVAASRAWPSVAASVARSQLRERPTRAGREYIPEVVYDYRAGGQPYRSGRLHFGETIAYNRKRRAEQRLAALTASAAAVVFYDPDNPARAVVERSAPVLRRDGLLLALAIVLLAGSIVGLLVGL